MRHLYLQSVQADLARLQPDDASGCLFPLRSLDPAGGRLQAEDVSPFARHSPLHELGQLLRIEPDGESEPERGVLHACSGQAVDPRGGTVIEDPLPETRYRGGELVPGFEPAPRHLVPRLRRFAGFSRTGQAGRLVEQRPAEVDVVEDHQRLRLETLVLYFVLDPYA